MTALPHSWLILLAALAGLSACATHPTPKAKFDTRALQFSVFSYGKPDPAPEKFSNRLIAANVGQSSSRSEKTVHDRIEVEPGKPLTYHVTAHGAPVRIKFFDSSPERKLVEARAGLDFGGTLESVADGAMSYTIDVPNEGAATGILTLRQ